MKERKILLIEDDPSLRAAVATFLTRLHYHVDIFHSADEAMKVVNEEYDVILSDVMMPGLSGYDLLKYVRKKCPKVPLILMTAYGSIEKAVEAMKNGAYDFLVKPFSLQILEIAIHAALLDRQSSARTNLATYDQGMPISPMATRLKSKRISDNFMTRDPKMLEIIESIKRIATSKATVLIQGESGTGKELIARMIHEFSPRHERIFVAINCAAMPDTLLESELFGHEKGSFTGAISRQIGKFELSNNGTILLDEISEMSLTMQTKLLRVLQECEIYRVGGVKSIPLNLRVIATTNRDLFEYTKQGHFREDLYYRLNVIPIHVTPLRERGNDVLYLAKEFIDEFAILHARKPLEFSEQSKRKILEHPWHGNVRELRNAMERAVLVEDFDVIDDEAFNKENADSKKKAHNESFEIGLTLEEIEKRAILKTLDHCEGNRTKTAAMLGVSLRTLRNKIRNYGIKIELKV